MLDWIGRQVMQTGKAIADLGDLTGQICAGVVIPPYRGRDIFRQFYFVTNQSALIIAFCVSFAAVVTIIEASFHMKMIIQNDAMVPGFASMIILRELGSVVMALLLTAKVGAGYAAEVGSMQITEQVDALRMLGLNPIRFIAVPRFIACVLGGFLLAIIANLVCLYGAMLVCTLKLGITVQGFIAAMRTFVHFQDLIFAAVKGSAFGAVIPIFSCYFGFRCQPGAEGVGLATTKSVVATSVAIIAIDFILTFAFSGFY